VFCENPLYHQELRKSVNCEVEGGKIDPVVLFSDAPGDPGFGTCIPSFQTLSITSLLSTKGATPKISGQ